MSENARVEPRHAKSAIMRPVTGPRWMPLLASPVARSTPPRGEFASANRRRWPHARACQHVLKLSRTIGDLAGSDSIEVQHLAEALQYRPRWAV